MSGKEGINHNEAPGEKQEGEKYSGEVNKMYSGRKNGGGKEKWQNLVLLHYKCQERRNRDENVRAGKGK